MFNWKIFSIDNIVEKMRIAAVRFPLVFLLAFFATVIGLYLVGGNHEEIWGKFLLMAISGTFLFLGSAIFSEDKKNMKNVKIYSNLAVVFILFAYWYFFPKNINDYQEIHTIKTFFLNLSAIFFVLLAPVLKNGYLNGFWQWVKKLFFRFVFTFISSFTLFIGTALSLASINFLFGVNINEEWYVRLWIIVVGLISTSVFMAGIPRDFVALDKEKDYPTVVRIFSQYILLPLIILYALILYAYGAKIVFTWNWPEGTVSYLVLVFSLIGIVAMLLLYPEKERMSWIGKVSKIFYVTLIPLIVLLFGAIYVRIHTYGLTANRLMVVILGFWLTGLSIYFIFTKKYNIKMVPATLLFLIIFFGFGPWNIFSVSGSSQTKKLGKILVEKNILVNGKISSRGKDAIDKNDYSQIRSILDYLYSIDEMDKVEKWIPEGMEISKESPYESADSIFFTMGITEKETERLFEEIDSASESHMSINVEKENFLSIRNFDYLFEFGTGNKDGRSMALDGKKISIVKDGMLIVAKEKIGNEKSKIIASKDLVQFIDDLSKKYKLDSQNITVPRDDFAIILENDEFSIVIYPSNYFSFYREKGKISKIENFDGIALVRVKK